MTPIDLRRIESQPTVFTIQVRSQPRRFRGATGVPVALVDDDGLALWTPILGPATVLAARLLLTEPGRTWHIGDVAGHLALGADYTKRVLRRLAQYGWLHAVDDDGSATYHVLAASNLKDTQLERLHPELAARYARLNALVRPRP